MHMLTPLLLLIISLTLVGCGGGDDDHTSEASGSPVSTQPPDTMTHVTPPYAAKDSSFPIEVPAGQTMEIETSQGFLVRAKGPTMLSVPVTGNNGLSLLVTVGLGRNRWQEVVKVVDTSDADVGRFIVQDKAVTPGTTVRITPFVGASTRVVERGSIFLVETPMNASGGAFTYQVQ